MVLLKASCKKTDVNMSKMVRVFFLCIVYGMLLSSVIIPHHHHEEVACFTTTHCEEDIAAHQHKAEEPSDHHHDHEQSEQQHCITIGYYVLSDAGINIKRVFDYVQPVYGNSHFVIGDFCVEEQSQRFYSKDIPFSEIPLQNSYTTYIKHEIPLRAPPYQMM
jgi:hypothetical protein